ncbi:hypothetical protein PROFUN_03334 [Planoprotostelium fungivorum]|uniref:Uncharacterized protein n=1 Tax=Planoprotostelium fungivorum TaxID=1890364 RepID=A0A2P6NWT5_9EUKA|nr:hypothetical protein PROFUN_03334 [Planoprotostelium fungivorum]
MISTVFLRIGITVDSIPFIRNQSTTCALLRGRYTAPGANLPSQASTTMA